MYRPFDYKKSLTDSVDSVIYYQEANLRDTYGNRNFLYKSLVNYSEIIVYTDTKDNFFNLSNIKDLDSNVYRKSEDTTKTDSN